jgi:two-component system cell cycle sensor histidine kinase/response regulator CckA
MSGKLWVFRNAVEPFNAHNSRREWRSGIPVQVVILLFTLVFAVFTLAFLRARPSVPPALWWIAGGLLVLLLLLDFTAMYRQLHNDRLSREWCDELMLFRLIRENAADMIAVVDVNGTRLYNSPSYEKILGYSPEELIRTDSFEQIHPDDRQRVKEAAQQARQTGQGRMLEYRFRHKDGTWRLLESTASLIHGRKGEPDKFVIVNRDITGRREAEKALRESELRQTQRMEAVGRLSGGIAHDFNNLLGVMIGYTDILEMGLREGDPARKTVEEIRKTGQRAAALTRQLLAFSRRQVLEPKVLDLNAVVTDIEKMLRRLIGENIELKTVLAPSLGQLQADQGQIEQVIINLAVNARDAMPQGGKLAIETANVLLDDTAVRHMPTARPGDYVMLAVSDTGIGMGPETRAKIFEPFFTTKEAGKGTGLGLATIYDVVKRSEGHIWVYSELGKGSVFKIYFPRVQAGAQAAAGEVRQSRAGAASETILVVEDDESLRDVTRDLLVQSGYRVLQASSGEQALQVVDRYRAPIHLLLADVVMPGMSGAALAAELTHSHPEIHVLYMSGYTDETILRSGVLKPGILLLEKPFTREALIGKVRDALGQPLAASGGAGAYSVTEQLNSSAG